MLFVNIVVMACSYHYFFYSFLFLLLCGPSSSYHHHPHRRYSSDPLHLFNISAQFQPLSFKEGYSIVFGGPDHVKLLDDGFVVQLTLDRSEGSGFISQDDYYYGFFSASIKLPSKYSAGIVVAFYVKFFTLVSQSWFFLVLPSLENLSFGENLQMLLFNIFLQTSNWDVFPGSHDELDFEFLGHISGKQWVLQTNMYANGSVNTGREERFHFWFDPTADFHEYSLLWNQNHTVFFVDNIPIREMMRSEAMGAQYPSKPMSVYSTIWDGSGWATEGGKFPVDYTYAPFVSTYSGLELEGCVWNPTQAVPQCQSRLDAIDPIGGSPYLNLSPEQRHGLGWVREKYMFYSYCDDSRRYPEPLPECAGRREGGKAEGGGRVGMAGGEEEELRTTEMTSFFKFSSQPASMRVPRAGYTRRSKAWWL